MYWILAAVFVYIAIAVPRLRAIAIAGFVILSILLGWGMAQRWRSQDPAATVSAPERGRPSSPAVVQQGVPVDSIHAEDMRLTGGGAPFELHGRIRNDTQDMMLKSVTIRLTRLDCHEGTLHPSGCESIWQEQHWITVSVPPQQTREFASSIWRRGGAPRPRGTIQDRFEIVAATGEHVAREAAGTQSPPDDEIAGQRVSGDDVTGTDPSGADVPDADARQP